MKKTQVEQSSANHVFLMHEALIILYNFVNRCGWYYVPVHVILICAQMLSLGLIKHHAVKTYTVGRTYVSKCSCTHKLVGGYLSASRSRHNNNG